MERTYYSWIESPIGTLLLTSDPTGALRSIVMRNRGGRPLVERDWRHDDVLLDEPRVQLREYFAGQRQTFTLRLAIHGTPFQQRVWQALGALHFGETVSYGELARRIGEPGAARAVGLANHHNPVPIVVPCHRVIGSNGALTGFGGGIERKRWLLSHEARLAAGPRRGDAPYVADLFA